MEIVVLTLSVIAHLIIGLITFRHNPKSLTNKFFFLFTIVASIWSVNQYLSLHQGSPEASLYYIRWAMTLASLYSFSLFITIHTFPSPILQMRKSRFIILILLTLCIAILSQTPLIFADIHGFGPEAEPIPGHLIPLFALFAGYCILGSIYILIARYRKANGQLKAQLQYLIVGVVGSALLLFFTNFVVVVLFNNTSLIILGPTYTLIFIGATAYAIVAHQLFDIRVIIRRTVEYSGLLVFTLAVYSMVVFFFSSIFGGGDIFSFRNLVDNLVAAFLIALGFDPLRRFLARTTDKFLFKGEYDQQAVLTALSQKLSDSGDLNETLLSLVSIIKSQLRLNHAAVITFSTEDKQVMIKNIAQDGYDDTSILQLPPENALILQFAHQPQVLVREYLRQQCEAKKISESWRQVCQFLLVDLVKLEIAIAIPILVNEKAIGIFLVGDKLSGDIYNQNEIAFLSIVANQTANTIEKARFWEEDQMKSEFVSIASHELLTPTAAMKGYLSMILDDNMGQVDDTARRYLTKVAQSSDRLAQLVEELLNVSRIESGRLRVHKRQFSLVDSAAHAVDELQVNAKKKHLDVSFVGPMNNLPTVFADPDHVYRVLINLVGNSIKYTSSGWVRAFVTNYSPTHLLFAVSDSGLGIPKENQDKLFEKFYRAERKEIAGIQGTGLGLYISKKIVELMDGQMWFVSEIGKGSTFYFTLPIFNPELHHEIIQPAAAPASTTA